MSSRAAIAYSGCVFRKPSQPLKTAWVEVRQLSEERRDVVADVDQGIYCPGRGHERERDVVLPSSEFCSTSRLKGGLSSHSGCQGIENDGDFSRKLTLAGPMDVERGQAAHVARHCE